QIIEEAPETEAAWLGLAGVVNGKEEKTAVYNRILQINPENTTAQAKLAQLQSGAAESFERPRNWLDSVTESPEVEEAANATANTGRVEETAVPIPEHASDDAVGDNFDLACYRHPNRETSLRCYNCGKPICIKCAQKTPVGYSCPDCIRDVQKGYYNATILDYIIAVIVAVPLSAVAAFFLQLIGFFTFFISPVAGTLIGRIVFWAVRRHRGRWLSHVVAGAVVLGAGIIMLMFGLSIWTGVYAFMAAASAFYFVKV
ncbi:MAG: hypothetical protein GY803_07340, partial [Chloroflexi bacterium]|nr:hypothetical protein [Chloroflexota bacterium]